VCHGDKSDERVLFHRTGSISFDKSRSIGFLIMNATTVCVLRVGEDCRDVYGDTYKR